MTPLDELVVRGPRALRGRLRVPGDKGVSHRALIAAALANGTSRIEHVASGDDVARTRAALAAVGVAIEASGDGAKIDGAGIDALHPPTAPLDCGNSGTTMRMLAGLLAGRPFPSVLTGDDSLLRRPMGRVVQPLRRLGARIDGRDAGRRAPLTIQGAELNGARVELEAASGQVKTALLLAGLQATGTTEVVEPAPSRDHTERLLAALGVPLEQVDAVTVRVRAGAPRAFELDVPGDPSSAAFFVVAALIAPGSDVVLEDLLLNPGRIAFLEVLRDMGGAIDVDERGHRLGEPVGDVHVIASDLRATTIDCTEAIIDEVPALAIAAACAEGITAIRNASELRVKESDRIATLEHELTQLGVGTETTADGLVVHGGHLRPATLQSHGDHRVAMAAAIAANAAEGESRVRGWGSVQVSYPGFADDLAGLASEA
jgi:3-phosphoshikimate 1-carboxyvinyltransferase